MMAFIEIVLVVFGPVVAGLGLLALISPARPARMLERAAWALPLGALVTAALVGAWIASGAPPVRLIGMLLPLLAGALGFALRPRARVRDAGPAAARGGRIERGVFFVVAAILAAVLVDRMLVFDARPIIAGDEGLIYAMRAKLLYHGWTGHSTALQFDPDFATIHVPDYPLLDPLLQAWVFLVSGRLTDIQNRLPFQAILLSLVLVSAARLRGVLRPGAAAVLLLLWLPGKWLVHIYATAQPDVLVACGFLLALEAWRDFRAEDGAGSWRTFACSLAILVWAKHEGSMLALCVLAACASCAACDRVMRRRLAGLRWNWAWLLLPIAIVASTWTVNSASGFSNYLVANGGGGGLVHRIATQMGDRAWTIAKWLWTDVLTAPDVSRLLWFPFAVVVLLLPRLAFSSLRAPATLAILGAAAGYFLVFCGWQPPGGGHVPGQDVTWQLGVAGGRVFFHLWPALLVWTARVTAELFPVLSIDTESNHVAIDLLPAR